MPATTTDLGIWLNGKMVLYFVSLVVNLNLRIIYYANLKVVTER
jgi:hypothetical protein